MNAAPKAKYPITIAGQKLLLQFAISDASSKQGINMQFVMEQEPQDVRDRDALKDKLSVVLQKKFGDANIPLDYNERNPYKNVISFIVPMSSISKMLVDVLKGGGGE